MKSAIKMDHITISPPAFIFDNILLTNRPISFDFSIKNNGPEPIKIDFANASQEDKFWFTSLNDTIKNQRKLGFDLFFSVKKLSNFFLDRDKEENLSFVILPNQCTSNFPSSISLPIRLIQDINTFRESDPFFINIPVKSQFSEILFKVSPRNLFLNDCCKDQIQTKTFLIKNRCAHKLPIMIFPPENITITTPELKNYVEVNPNDSVSLVLTHKPTEIGQFNYRILFDCILSSNSEPQEMKLMTSVSPPDIPPDFPVITPENSQIDFGEIHTGAKVCKSFTITNPGDHLYDVSVASVFDIFLNNSSSQSSTNLPSQVTFRNASSSVSQNKLSIRLHPHSGITIFIEYRPVFHQKADTSSFEHRTFMISLSFSDNKTHSTYYRRIKCKSAVCHSMISVTPTTIDFGDTIVGRSDKTFSIKVENSSPLPTTVRLFPSSRSLVIPPGPLVVPGHSHTKFVVTFYPKKINPEYNSTIIITNENNPSNEIHISISAIVIPGESESLHSMCYTLYSNVSHLTSLSLNNCASNYPIIKSFYIKNRTNKFLKIRLSSSTDEISFYMEKNSTSPDSGSQSNFLYLSSSNDNNVYQTQQIQQSGNSLSSSSTATTSATSLVETFTLLTNDASVTSLKQCESIMKINSDFFTNQFTLLEKNSEIAVVEHFSILLKKFKALIGNEDYATNITKSELEIPPQYRTEIFMVLIPHGNSLLWKHRVEKISVELLNPPADIKQQKQQQQLPLVANADAEIIKGSNEGNLTTKINDNSNSKDSDGNDNKKITEKLKPLEIPVIFNEATSASFLSSHSLFFGTIQRNNVSQKKIYLNNESSLPLLFNFESDAVIFKKKKSGIILPFDSLSAPFSMCPKIDGEMLEKISVQNILNPEEKQEIKLKGTVVRRSNFIVDPTTLDFGVISTGQSSHKLLVFVTNTSNDWNELTFLHNHKENGQLKPLITFQLKNSNSKRLTESMRYQIEKLEQKLRCLKRKNKTVYAEQVQHLLDNLTSTQKQTNTSPQIKHMMNTKYMDHFGFNESPFQMIAVELQLITIVKSGERRGQFNGEIEGSILIYEKGRTESQKIIHYKARVNPKEQRLLQQISENPSKLNSSDQLQENSSSLVIEPKSFNLKHLHVQECKSLEITIKNTSSKTQNYWISSDSTRDCIISSPKNEGSIEPNESHIIRVDIFCTAPGEMNKSIMVTTENSMQVVPFQIQSEFQNLLTFAGVNLVMIENESSNVSQNESDFEQIQKMVIDFGNFPLTSLQVVEKRSSFTICNTTPKRLYVKIINDDEDDVLLYEHDPKEPLNLPFPLEAKATVIINVLMKSEIDTITYIKYRTKIVDAKLTIKTFGTMEEATESSSCLSMDLIQVHAKVGRVGIRLSQKVVDLGKVKKGVCEASLMVKNKSTHIPIDVLITASQGLAIDQSIFHINGKKVISNSSKALSQTKSSGVFGEKIDLNDKKKNPNCTKKINFKFTPSSNGINEAKLQFTINGIPSYSKAATVTAFVDPEIIQTDLPLNDKQIDSLDIGEIYVNNGRPVPKTAIINLTNNSNYSQTVEFHNQEFTIGSKMTKKVSFDFPFPDYAYNPEETKFAYRLTCLSFTTHTVFKIIEVIGEFSISIGSLSHDTVSLGQFGKFNNFKYDEKHISINNKSNIPLIIKPFCKPPLLAMPNEMLPPIMPNEKYKFNLIPDIDKLKNLNFEGTQTISLNFINQNNLQNQMKATVTFDILSSTLQFGRIEKEDGIMKLTMTKFAPFVVPDEESENGTTETYIANSWFTITNHQNNECSVKIDVELLNPDLIYIEIFLRKSEIKITQFDLQPNESTEIRVKANMKKSKGFDKKLECSLAKVTFNSEYDEPISMLIVYQPEEALY